jgi:hypothetical protein
VSTNALPPIEDGKQHLDPEALATIASLLEVGASIVSGVATGDVGAGARIADGLLLMIQKGISAYQKVSGQPIDPALLKPFEPVV